MINLGDVQDLADRLRPEYTANNLPAEFTDALPDILEIDQDMRVFIRQLRFFNAPKSMVEQAIVNYFRAFEQRTKWASDGLLDPGELSRYDQQLYEQWAEHQSFLELMGDMRTEQDKQQRSGKLYQKCLQNSVVPIRRDFLQSYVAKGSYQILSDQLRIGWHPDYLDKLGVSSNEDVA